MKDESFRSLTVSSVAVNTSVLIQHPLHQHDVKGNLHTWTLREGL